MVRHNSSHSSVKMEQRPLLDLIATGHIARIDVAALAYLPSALNEQQRAAVQQWSGGRPVLTHIVDTPFGRVGLFSLPIEGDALYIESEWLLELSREAVFLAKAAGAQIIALTGLLPSALDYGHELVSALRGEQHPVITTGHATTTTAVVLNIKHLLEEAGRHLAQETVAFIGLGSIGQTTLRLMLRVLPHPQSLLLCDLYSKQQNLEELAVTLRKEGYRGEVHIARARAGNIPQEVYDMTMLIGATNVADVMDIWRVSPGCIIIDDSWPHCFNSEQAVLRMRQQGDILMTEGGELGTPWAMSELRYLPPGSAIIEHLMATEDMIALRNNPCEIMGCLFTGMVSHQLDVPTTLGSVDVSVSIQHFEALIKAGFSAAELHLSNEVISSYYIEQFRQRFRRNGSGYNESSTGEEYRASLPGDSKTI